MYPLIARNANNGHSQQRGVGLTDVTVQTSFTNFFNKDGVCVLHYTTSGVVDLDTNDPHPQPWPWERLAPNQLFG